MDEKDFILKTAKLAENKAPFGSDGDFLKLSSIISTLDKVFLSVDSYMYIVHHFQTYLSQFVTIPQAD